MVDTASVGVGTLWSYLFAGIKLAYSSMYWSKEFPPGMYTTCTVYLGNMLALDFLTDVSCYFIYVALSAWTLTLLGLLKAISRNFFTNDRIKG